MIRRTVRSYRKHLRSKYKKNLKKCVHQIHQQEVTQYFAKEMDFLMRELKAKFPITGDVREAIQKRYPIVMKKKLPVILKKIPAPKTKAPEKLPDDYMRDN